MSKQIIIIKGNNTQKIKAFHFNLLTRFFKSRGKVCFNSKGNQIKRDIKAFRSSIVIHSITQFSAIEFSLKLCDSNVAFLPRRQQGSTAHQESISISDDLEDLSWVRKQIWITITSIVLALQSSLLWRSVTLPLWTYQRYNQHEIKGYCCCEYVPSEYEQWRQNVKQASLI